MFRRYAGVFAAAPAARRWASNAACQQVGKRRMPPYFQAIIAAKDQTIADIKASKEQAIADIKASKDQAIARQEQAIADIKESKDQTIATMQNLLVVTNNAKVSAEAQLSAARGTLSRRAAYEMVLHAVFAASKLLEPCSVKSLPNKFNATITETWLLENALNLSQCGVPTLEAAANCAKCHLLDKETGKVKPVKLYAKLSNAIHGTGLDAANLKTMPENDHSIDESMHNFFVCLLQSVLML